MKGVVATDTGLVVTVGSYAFEAAVWVGNWTSTGD